MPYTLRRRERYRPRAERTYSRLLAPRVRRCYNRNLIRVSSKGTLGRRIHEHLVTGPGPESLSVAHGTKDLSADGLPAAGESSSSWCSLVIRLAETCHPAATGIRHRSSNGLRSLHDGKGGGVGQFCCRVDWRRHGRVGNRAYLRRVAACARAAGWGACTIAGGAAGYWRRRFASALTAHARARSRREHPQVALARPRPRVAPPTTAGVLRQLRI